MTLVSPEAYYDHIISVWPHPWSIRDHTHMVFLGGSHGQGLSHDNSVLDITSVVIPPVEYLLGLEEFSGFVHHSPHLDVVVYGIHKFVAMVVKANPNMMELIFTHPTTQIHTPFSSFIVSNKTRLISKKTIKTLIISAGRLAPKECAQTGVYDYKKAALAMRRLIFARDMIYKRELACSTLTGSNQDLCKHIKKGSYTFSEYRNVLSSFTEKIEKEASDAVMPEDLNRNFFNRKMIESLRIFT